MPHGEGTILPQPKRNLYIMPILQVQLSDNAQILNINPVRPRLYQPEKELVPIRYRH